MMKQGQAPAAPIRDTVRRWTELDPDPRTRQDLLDLISAADDGDLSASAELEQLFAGRLAFGTAGLRAQLGAGPMRMNRLVVRQTAAGLLTFAQRTMKQAAGRIVIGYDARHQSDQFAFETAQVFGAAGWEVRIFDRPGPTPLLARQVLAAEADIGVMVTASHNPSQDSGYKVYLGAELSRTLEPHGYGVGAQITAPVDQQIASTIAEVLEPDLAEDGTTPETLGPVPVEAEVRAPDEVTLIGDQERAAYRREALELLDPSSCANRDLRIVYTAMHGVGGETATGLLAEAGFDDVIIVAEQYEPDPDFPTAPFPNPEEDGALDAALRAAVDHDADLVLANDPDADRLAAAVFDPFRTAWRQLSGDEMGALLGRYILDRGALRSPGGEPVLANSVVSSRLLERLCRVRGVGHAATLTGFKWLSRVPGMIFGYEEAIGFSVDPVSVQDKDGISAALVFAELAATLKTQGSGPIQALDEIAAEAGVFVTGQVTVRVEDLSQLGRVTAALRQSPPAQIAGSEVVESLDLIRDPLPGQEFDDATKTDALIYLTEAGDRVIVRPSGTEPKVKCYLEAVEDTPDAHADRRAIVAARDRAADRLKELYDAMTAILGEADQP